MDASDAENEGLERGRGKNQKRKREREKNKKNENSSSGTTRSGKGQRGCSSSKKKEKRGRKFIQTETNCHQASGMGGKSPDQPLVLDIWRKIPSEPLTGRPRSVKFYWGERGRGRDKRLGG